MRETIINNEDVYDIIEIKTRLTPIFRKNRIKKAVLFGSYAKGEARPRSDIDILVDSGLKGLSFIGFAGLVREALQKEVDVIDVHYLKKNSNVDHEIQKSGLLIYGE